MLINLQNTSDLTNHLNSLDTFVIIRHHSSSFVIIGPSFISNSSPRKAHCIWGGCPDHHHPCSAACHCRPCSWMDACSSALLKWSSVYFSESNSELDVLRCSLTFALKCWRSRSGKKSFKIIGQLSWYTLTYLWPSFFTNRTCRWLCGVRCCELWNYIDGCLGAELTKLQHWTSKFNFAACCPFNLSCLSRSCDLVPSVDWGLKPGCIWVKW